MMIIKSEFEMIYKQSLSKNSKSYQWYPVLDLGVKKRAVRKEIKPVCYTL